MKQTTADRLFRRSRMTESYYRAAHGVNKSTLFELEKSAAHYKFLLDNPREDTPSLILGRAFHAAALQPRAFRHEYAAAPDVDRRTKEGRAAFEAFQVQNVGREIIKADVYQQARRMAQAVRKEAGHLLEGCTMEKAVFWLDKDTGLPCKGRLDAVKPGTIIELKSTADASTRAFTRDLFSLGYDVQIGHYSRGYNAITGAWPEWFIIAVETKEPYAVHVFRVDQGIIDHGIEHRDRLMQQLKTCQASGVWPGYGQTDLLLPAYMA